MIAGRLATGIRLDQADCERYHPSVTGQYREWEENSNGEFCSLLSSRCLRMMLATQAVLYQYF